MKRVTVSAGPAHRDRKTVENDPAWNKLGAATPAQIDVWLELNVTTVADVRKVLRLLIIAVRALHNKG